ncbi:MAG: succinyldiaminopimelate transaminase, partial [Pseudomonadota bacterium]
MNRTLQRLHPYPFERLAALLGGVEPPKGKSPIAMTIGEPKHGPPGFVLEALEASLPAGAARYPATRGSAELLGAAAGWFERRFGVALDPERQVLALAGTREGLFSVAQALVDRTAVSPRVVMPNPCYQIYEGAALMAGAEPWYWRAADGVPSFDDVPARVWDTTQLVYCCSPGNPTGAVLDPAFYRRLLERAARHGFVIVADECYADIYRQDPPCSLLQAAAATGNDRFERCLVFHSLSKRSNLPGLRSGFVAGDAALLERYARFRTYHGCSLPGLVQAASIAAWNDDEHAATNRERYNRKFDAVVPVLAEVWDLAAPPGAFYLWPRTGTDSEALARDLYAAAGVLTLPGAYLGRAA